MNDFVEVSLKDILKEIDDNLFRAGWTKERAREHLIFNYHKNSRLRLNDDELLDFLAFTRQLPIKRFLEFRKIEFPYCPQANISVSHESQIEPLF